MKKILTLVTAAILLLALCTACGTKDVDLQAVMDDINSQYELTDLKTIEDTDGLHRYFQIEAEDVKQFAAELTTSAKKYSEVILVEAAGQNAADTIQTQLDAHLHSQLSNAKSYDAEQVAMLEACEVKQNGNYVYLVIGDNHQEIADIIETALQ